VAAGGDQQLPIAQGEARYDLVGDNGGYSQVLLYFAVFEFVQSNNAYTFSHRRCYLLGQGCF
jgi:hypothetical protein